MATYQRRGSKKTIETTDVEEVIADNNIEKTSTTAEVFKTLDESASKSEKWIENNTKPLLIAFGVVIACILGYLAYDNLIATPKENEAANALVFAKNDFTAAVNAQQPALYKAALNGQGGNYGLVNIADKYSGTKAGNLANYYAGISYIKLNQYTKAIEYLEKVSSDDELFEAVISGSIADCYYETNQLESALENYTKAAEKTEIDPVAPTFYLKAGKTALLLKDYKTAEELFTNIKEQYANSTAAANIDLFIHQAKHQQ